MAAKMQTSRAKRGLDEDLEGEGLPAAPAPQIQIQGNEQLQMPQPPKLSRDPVTELSRIEMRDMVAMGGVDPLRLQSMIRSNPFLSDEDVHALTGGAKGPQYSAPQSIERPPIDLFSGPAASSGPNPHAAPLGGTEALGAEGALAPQGLMAPQGIMTKVGMLGFVKGLLGVRSDGPQPMQQQSASAQKQQNSQAAPKQQSAAASASQSPSSAQSPATAQAAAAKSQAQRGSEKAPAQDPRSMSSEQAGQSQERNLMKQPDVGQAPASSLYSPVESSFQPVQAEGNNWFGNAMWGNKSSPFVELLNRFFALIKLLIFGSDPPPPHLRGGNNH